MPTPDELLDRLDELPAAAPLLPVLRGMDDVWLVGGAVRDLLLGGAPVDLDVVVVGDAPAVARALAERLGGELLQHDRFGTATVRAAGHSYDVVRARAETYARPGALPDVRPGTLAEDLARRDFTVNAIALSLDGRLEAVPHAFDDLAAGRLRVLHPVSFRDDPTRLLRLVRYATRLRFAVEQETATWAREAVDGGALETVTGTRIGGELRLLLREPAAAEALAEVARWGAGDALVPGLSFDAELAARAGALLPPDGRSDLLLLAVAAVRVAPRRLTGWLDALGFTARERDTVVGAAAGAKRVADRLRALAAGGVAGASGGAGDVGGVGADAGVRDVRGPVRPSAVAALLRGASPEQAALAGALAGEEAAALVAGWLARDRHVTLEIDGDDLRAAGVPQGAAIGRGLAAARDAKLDGAARDRAAELAAALAVVGPEPRA